ncbi:MAG: asparagine synthase-related protein [Candidatus Aminicenantes bacterium]
MIIENGMVKSRSPDIEYYEDPDFQVYFQGFIYIPYVKSGIESIKKILAGIENNKINDIENIRGHFFIFIINKATNYKYFFIDNSGIFKGFISDNVISTSMLELARYLHLDSSKLNFNAVVEFLHFGFTYLDRTFFENMRRINKNEIIVYNQNNEQAIEDKELKKINEPINLDMLDFFQGLYESVKEKKISLDLTGGIDSRMIAGLFNYLGADFEFAVSGTKGHKDIEIARKISEILKKSIFVYYHNIDDVTDDSLRNLFYLTDAQTDILNYHRKYQLILQRKERGIDMQITGAGGEFYKDHWWLQDFPFYNKKNADIEKLYRLRIEPIIYPHDYLGHKTKTISLELKDNIIKQLYQYKLETNTQTYDNISYNYKIQSYPGIYVTTGNQLINTYAPLVESDLVRSGFALKRRNRFFINFHREIISTYCPMISSIKTIEGVTCSMRKIDKLKDLTRYVSDKQKRFTKQILRKLLKKTYLNAPLTDRGIYKKVANLDIFKNQIEILKEHEIVRKDLKIEEIKDNYIGKFLVISLLLREL